MWDQMYKTTRWYSSVCKIVKLVRESLTNLQNVVNVAYRLKVWFRYRLRVRGRLKPGQ
jgi:hypothetical protein